MTKHDINVGSDWLLGEIDQFSEKIERITPVRFNEENRYLPESVTPLPGFIQFSVNPFMKEIVDGFCVDNQVREVVVKKGVQITYTIAELGNARLIFLTTLV